MSHLIWSPSALLDVQRLYRFLTAQNVAAAKRAVQVIRESTKNIAKHPEIGRPANNMEPEYREWLIDFGNNGYIVLYRYDGSSTIIVAVRHQREAGY